MIIDRYVRLTPSVAMMILVNYALAHFLNNSNTPQTFFNYSVNPCREYWWSTLLHLQVYTNPHEMVSFVNFFLHSETLLIESLFSVHAHNLVSLW